VSKKRVLVVDDDILTLEALKETLSPYYDVFRALQPKDGLMLAKSGRYDLIILDISMPRMSGFDLIEHFRAEADPEYWDTPFILLSSFKSKKFIARATELGIEFYLDKPIDPEQLLLTTEYILHPDDR